MSKWMHIGGFMIKDLRVTLKNGSRRVSRQVYKDKSGTYVVIDYKKVYANDIEPMYKWEGGTK